MTILSITQDKGDFQEQKPQSQLNFNEATAFLDALAEGEVITFQTFDDNDKHKDKQLVRVLHGTLKEHATELERLNREGAGIFVTVNQTDGKGRGAANITKTRAVFVDLDGAPLGPVLEASVTPQIVIESSPGRYHAYWFVTDLPLDQFKKVQQALAVKFNGDSKVIDLPRVMRIPGFFHQKKQGEPFLSRIIENTGGLPIMASAFLAAFGINPNEEVHTSSDAPEGNLVLSELKARKVLLGRQKDRDGTWKIRCPWAENHTNVQENEAFYYEPHTNGYEGHGFFCCHAHCDGRIGDRKTIDDVMRWLGLDLHTAWEEAIPLPAGLPPVAALEADMIPESLRGWITDIAERMQISLDYPAAGALVVLGSIVGRKVGIHPKCKDDWLVVPNLWGAIVGRPALLKSPAIAEIMKPLKRLINTASEKYEEEIKQFEVEELAISAKKEAGIKKLRREADQGHNLSAITEAIFEIESLKKPTQKRYKTEDSTVEKLGELLVENPNGLLVYRDELMGWLRSLDKDGREGDRAFFLEAWNGTGDFHVDRIKRGSIRIPALCISLLGSIQPGPLSSYIYQATKGGVGDDGLLQRFQILVWPDVSSQWKNVDCLPDNDAKERAFDVFRQLDLFIPIGDVIDPDAEIPGLHYTLEAQKAADTWREELEYRIRSGNLPPALESHLAKYRSLMPSLALIFQLCNDLDPRNPVEPKAVGIEAVRNSIRWCAYLETHARRLYSSVDSSGIESARALIKRIEMGDVKDDFSTRDVYLKNWSRLSSPDEVQRAVDFLIEYKWLRYEHVKKPMGRPALKIRIHPDLKQYEHRSS